MGCSASSATVPTTAAAVDTPDFLSRFELGEELGAGAFGQVRAVTSRDSPRGDALPLAVKIIELSSERASGEQLWLEARNEYRCWKRLGCHPNVVRLSGFFLEQKADESPNVAYMLMERCGVNLGHCLHDLVGNDMLCGYVLKSMLTAIAHVHHRGVVHRDVKFANFLVSGPVLKLCDFGLAAIVPECGYLSSAVGTHAYMAPEVIQHQRYDYSVDLWSIGVCWYRMLFRTFPYAPKRGDNSKTAWKDAVVRGVPPSFLPRKGEAPSEKAAALARHLLRRQAHMRPSANCAMRMDYFRQRTSEPSICLELALSGRSMTSSRTESQSHALPVTPESPKSPPGTVDASCQSTKRCASTKSTSHVEQWSLSGASEGLESPVAASLDPFPKLRCEC